MDQPYDLARFSVTFGLELGIDQFTVHADLEAAAVRWNDGDALDQRLKLPEQIVRQAHGPPGVMSDRAVNNLDFEHKASPLRG
jgi:hypothetical protein